MGKRFRCLFLCSSVNPSKIYHLQLVFLRFPAITALLLNVQTFCFVQPLIFQCTQQRRSLTKCLVIICICICKLLWLQALNVCFALRHLKSQGNVSAETMDRKWNQKCTSKRADVYKDEQISCQTHPFHLCLSYEEQDACFQVEHFTNLTCFVRHLTFHVTQRLLEKMERGN